MRARISPVASVQYNALRSVQLLLAGARGAWLKLMAVAVASARSSEANHVALRIGGVHWKKGCAAPTSTVPASTDEYLAHGAVSMLGADGVIVAVLFLFDAGFTYSQYWVWICPRSVESGARRTNKIVVLREKPQGAVPLCFGRCPCSARHQRRLQERHAAAE